MTRLRLHPHIVEDPHCLLKRISNNGTIQGWFIRWVIGHKLGENTLNHVTYLCWHICIFCATNIFLVCVCMKNKWIWVCHLFLPSFILTTIVPTTQRYRLASSFDKVLGSCCQGLKYKTHLHKKAIRALVSVI